MREEYTLRDVLDHYDDDFIINELVSDKYYVEVVADTIRENIPEFDKEDQDFYNDLRNNDILINAFRENVGDSELISLLIDAGYSHDIVRLIEQEYGFEDE